MTLQCSNLEVNESQYSHWSLLWCEHLCLFNFLFFNLIIIYLQLNDIYNTMIYYKRELISLDSWIKNQKIWVLLTFVFCL